MLKISQKQIQGMEKQYPGITENIYRFESASLPKCIYCSSTDTEDVQVGIIGRTIYICTAPTKFKLITNGPKPGNYWCNSCNRYFE